MTENDLVETRDSYKSGLILELPQKLVILDELMEVITCPG